MDEEEVGAPEARVVMGPQILSTDTDSLVTPIAYQYSIVLKFICGKEWDGIRRISNSQLRIRAKSCHDIARQTFFFTWLPYSIVCSRETVSFVLFLSFIFGMLACCGRKCDDDT